MCRAAPAASRSTKPSRCDPRGSTSASSAPWAQSIPSWQAAGISTVCLRQPQLLDASGIRVPLARALWNRPAYRATRSLLETLDRRHTVVHLHGYTKALTTTPALAARRAGFHRDLHAARLLRRLPERRLLRLPPAAAVHAACDVDRLRVAQLRQATPGAQGLSGCCVAWRSAHVARFPRTVRDYITLSRQSSRSAAALPARRTRSFMRWRISSTSRASRRSMQAATSNLWWSGRLDAEKGVMLAATAARAFRAADHLRRRRTLARGRRGDRRARHRLADRRRSAPRARTGALPGVSQPLVRDLRPGGR